MLNAMIWFARSGVPWRNLAEKRGVNCSQVLQDGLIQLFHTSHAG